MSEDIVKSPAAAGTFVTCATQVSRQMCYFSELSCFNGPLNMQLTHVENSYDRSELSGRRALEIQRKGSLRPRPVTQMAFKAKL